MIFLPHPAPAGQAPERTVSKAPPVSRIRAAMADSFYITTPIYYPNGEPHLGSVYTTTLCDVLARYHRLRGDKTYFLTGTDEHGTKMAKAADEAGVQPQVLADRYADIFRRTWEELRMSHDDFIRTTEPRHKQAVQQIVAQLLASGDIYLGSYQGWYDEGQEGGKDHRRDHNAGGNP